MILFVKIEEMHVSLDHSSCISHNSPLFQVSYAGKDSLELPSVSEKLHFSFVIESL